MPRDMSPTGDLMMRRLAGAMRTAGEHVLVNDQYRGVGELLVIYGVGAAERNEARNKHVASGRKVLVWDLGYFCREKITGHLRCSINDDHPQRYLDATKGDPRRWERLHLPLREDARKDGHILLIGLGSKSRSYLNEPDWEANQLESLKQRFPGRRIIYRPKPGHVSPFLDVETASTKATIEELLKGAALVICRHSNVACDATLAGVPFEAEDGAAMWLAQRAFTIENRLDFLRRLAFWQWRAVEAEAAWSFLKPRLH